MKTYKFSNHPHEKIVMNYMGILFRLGAIKQRVSIKSAFIGMADFLKITPAKDMSKILAPLQQNIINMVHVGKSAPENLTKTYEQITKSQKLVPYPHFEEAMIPARRNNIVSV